MRSYYVRRKDLSHVPFQFYVWADGRERPLDPGITNTFALIPPKGEYDVVHVLVVADFVRSLEEQWDVAEPDVLRVAAKALEAWLHDAVPPDHFYGPDFVKVDAQWYPAGPDGSPILALDPYNFHVETADPYPSLLDWPFFKRDAAVEGASINPPDPAMEDTRPRIVFGFTLDVFPGNLIVGYNQFKHKLADAGVDAVVSLTALDELLHDVSVLFVPPELAEAGRNAAPTAQLISLDTFLNHPAYPQVIAELQAWKLATYPPVREGSR